VKRVGAFRDESTRSQYVLLEVDTESWAADTRSRLEREIGRFEAKLARIKGRLKRKQVLHALVDTYKSRVIIERLGADLLSLSVLEPTDPTIKSVRDAMKGYEETLGQVLNQITVFLDIRSPDPGTSGALASDLGRFLAEHELAIVTKKANATVIAQVTAGARLLKEETVADRLEYVFVANGELQFIDSDGEIFAPLQIHFLGARHTERSTSRAAARTAAIRLAATTLAAKLRSQWRQLVRGE
jgi:hypothetical protein